MVLNHGSYCFPKTNIKTVKSAFQFADLHEKMFIELLVAVTIFIDAPAGYVRELNWFWHNEYVSHVNGAFQLALQTLHLLVFHLHQQLTSPSLLESKQLNSM